MTLFNRTALTDTEIPASALFPSARVRQAEWGVGQTDTETEREREMSAVREETFLWHEAKYNYQRDRVLEDRRKAIYGGREKEARDLLE